MLSGFVATFIYPFFFFFGEGAKYSEDDQMAMFARCG